VVCAVVLGMKEWNAEHTPHRDEVVAWQDHPSEPNPKPTNRNTKHTGRQQRDQAEPISQWHRCVCVCRPAAKGKGMRGCGGGRSQQAGSSTMVTDDRNRRLRMMPRF
jgi:hypothetical protein